MLFFHSFYFWISIRIFSFTTLEQVMGPQNKKLNEIKLFYIFFERNNYRKIHGLQVCLVLWSCVCFWELPRLKFERVESKGISSVCHVFASLNTNFVSLRPWQGAHGFSSRSNCKLGRTFTTSQGFCAGTTFAPWIFFFIPYFFEIHLWRFLIIYFCNCFFCSNDWNKISKFEREFWSNGKSRLHQGFFFVLLISSPSKQKGRLLLLIWSPFPFLKLWMGKKQHEIRREGRTNEKTMFTPRIFPFLCSLFFCEH